MEKKTTQPPWQRLSRMSAMAFGLVIVYGCYRYNADFGIGGKAFLQGMHLTTDMLFFLGLPLAATMLLNRFAPIRTNRMWVLALMVQAVVAYLLVDLHYWSHPSPELEGTYSDLWSRFLS